MASCRRARLSVACSPGCCRCVAGAAFDEVFQEYDNGLKWALRTAEMFAEGIQKGTYTLD